MSIPISVLQTNNSAYKAPCFTVYLPAGPYLGKPRVRGGHQEYVNLSKIILDTPYAP